MLYPKDTEKWKQFTTISWLDLTSTPLCCIPKILKNESNSQQAVANDDEITSCVVSQRYWKMKAIHNNKSASTFFEAVVLYPKDTEKWKQFTTSAKNCSLFILLCCIPKILKNESNSQQSSRGRCRSWCCVVSQRYWKMKAIHNIADKWMLII